MLKDELPWGGLVFFLDVLQEEMHQTGMTEDGHCNEELLKILVKVALRATKVHMRHSGPARPPSDICQDATATTVDDEGTHEDTWG